MNVPTELQRRAIEYARALVEDQVSCDVSPYDRLWQIARQLNVAKIEPGAVRTDGFVKRLSNGQFAIYYACKSSLQRRRYTVAHELGHLVLEEFLPHVDHTDSTARSRGVHSSIERTVDRIAAELIMPERLSLAAIESAAREARDSHGRINKFAVVNEARLRLGVSLTAMMLRMAELSDLLAVVCWQEFDLATNTQVSRKVRTSEHIDLSCIKTKTMIDSIAPRFVAGVFDGCGAHDVVIDTYWGLRRITCNSVMRRIDLDRPGLFGYWSIGWTWNMPDIPEFDDSCQCSQNRCDQIRD